MSFRSIIRNMKGDNGDISKKGLEVKIGYGLRSRSQRGVQDIAAPVVIDVLKQSCWANLPPELLRDVLVRLEASESGWPLRKHVVSCAGVCRSWREIMKEIVMTPEISGKLTFPISLKQPGPRDTLLPCLIKRNRNTQTYCLYLGLTQGKFLWRMLGTVLASRMRNRRIYDTHHRSSGNLAEWAPTERGCPGFFSQGHLRQVFHLEDRCLSYIFSLGLLVRYHHF